MANEKTISGKTAPTALPQASDLTPFAHGAAGHEGISSNASGSLVIKPCTQAEIGFYESAREHPDLYAHMPTFMGSIALNKDPEVQQISKDLTEGNRAAATTADSAGEQAWVPSGGKQLKTDLAIVLENAAAGFTRPNVLDLKLGARLWDDDSPEAKRQKLDQVAAETTSGSLGFRVAGMKVWLESTSDSGTAEVNTDISNGYKSYDKMYGRNLDSTNVSEAFIRVLGGTTNSATATATASSTAANLGSDAEDKIQFKRPRATILLQRFLREVQSIRSVLEKEESRMYSASILIVIEGDDEALENGLKQEKSSKSEDDDKASDDDDDEEDQEDEEIGPKVLEVRLIDFAHARFTPGEGPDENALRGVRNIQKILEDLVHSVAI